MKGLGFNVTAYLSICRIKLEILPRSTSRHQDIAKIAVYAVSVVEQVPLGLGVWVRIRVRVLG